MKSYGKLSLGGRAHTLATNYTLAGGGGGVRVTTLITTGQRILVPLPSSDPQTVTVSGGELHMSMSDADHVSELFESRAVFSASFPGLGYGGGVLEHDTCTILQKPELEPTRDRRFTRYNFVITLL